MATGRAPYTGVRLPVGQLEPTHESKQPGIWVRASKVPRFQFRITHRYETVEEIINDTFLVVWQRAQQFRFASRVSTLGAVSAARYQRAASIRMARKSFTLVSVGPVITESPSAWKNVCASLFASMSLGRRPSRHARASVSGAITAPAISS
jgi:hypothetical protein